LIHQKDLCGFCGKIFPQFGWMKTRVERSVSVENIGFEPITSSLPAKRSSQMS
jgi:hypothetical protein